MVAKRGTDSRAADAYAAPKRKPFFGYFVVVALILVCFCPVSFGMSCAGIFYASLAEHFGVGTGMLSYYSSLLQLAALIFLPIFGYLFGRVDARKLVCGATLLVAVDFFLLAHVASLWMFYGCSFLMGIGLAILLFLAPSTLVNRWFAKRAGFLTGIVMAFTGVGGVVWSTVGGAIINGAGFATAYTVFAAITAVIVPICWLCIASHPEDKGLVPYGYTAVSEERVAGAPRTAGAQRADKPARRSGGVSRTVMFALIFALSALLNMAMYAYFIIPSYIGSLEIGAALPLLGATAASAAMAGQTAAKVVLGFVGDRRPVGATCVALACGILGIFLLLMFPVSAAVIYAGACLFGIQYGIAFVMMPIFTKRIFGRANYATSYARVSMAASISSIIAGLAGGTIVDSGGGFALVFALVIGISALAVVATLAVGRAMAVGIAQPEQEEEETPALASFIPARLEQFVPIGEHAHARRNEAVAVEKGSSLGQDELELLSRKLRGVIDGYDAAVEARGEAEPDVSLAAYMPTQVESFVPQPEHSPTAAPEATAPGQGIGKSEMSLLSRKLLAVIDALDRNDSTEFEDDVRFVYGS